MSEYIKVTYDIASTSKQIKNFLNNIDNSPTLAFDTETRSIYSKKDKEVAAELIKTRSNPEYLQMAHMVAESSGLSFPEISKTTHFIFSNRDDHSTILVTDNPINEMRIWRKVQEYKGLLLIHNASFDLKTMYQRLGKLPANYVDTQLMAKCLINHVNEWKCKSGLKELMGSYYEPAWAMMKEYEPEDLLDPKFLQYAAVDGAATFKLYDMLYEHYYV